MSLRARHRADLLQLTSSSSFPPIHAADAFVSYKSDEGEELRCCYLTHYANSFRSSDLAGLAEPGITTISAGSQIEAILTSFVEGERYALLNLEKTPRFRKLRPNGMTGPHVWELRTESVRLFGWFPGPANTYAVASIRLKRTLLKLDGSDDNDAYAEEVARVVKFRTLNKLDSHIWKGLYDDLPIHLRC